MNYQSYKDMEIYRLAHKLAVEVHAMSLLLPPFEMYEEGSQIRRSAKSISSNIVEGYGRRRYKNEFIKFLTYALSSCDETREHLDIVFETKSLKDEKRYKYFFESYDGLGRKINKFLQGIEKQHLTSPREE
jgi:four helix bundle protein